MKERSDWREVLWQRYTQYLANWAVENANTRSYGTSPLTFYDWDEAQWSAGVKMEVVQAVVDSLKADDVTLAKLNEELSARYESCCENFNAFSTDELVHIERTMTMRGVILTQVEDELADRHMWCNDAFREFSTHKLYLLSFGDWKGDEHKRG